MTATPGGDTRPVTVVVRAAVTDQIMTGWDENGGMYETRIMGHRLFSKVLSLPIEPEAAPRIDINGHGYRPGPEATWDGTGEALLLHMRLREADNGPLEDCLADASWTEITTGVASGQ